MGQAPNDDDGVGSIAPGGRYDGLIGAVGVDPSSKEGKKAMGPEVGPRVSV